MSKDNQKSLPLEKVLERIEHWTNVVENAKSAPKPTTPKKLAKFITTNDNNKKLLSFWVGYKNTHFPNN